MCDMVYVCYLYMYVLCILCFFFFKQKTAYEMRISDWSSDVCSSDLGGKILPNNPERRVQLTISGKGSATKNFNPVSRKVNPFKIGRASCRERVCQYV